MKVDLFKSTGRITRTIVGGFLVLLLSSCSGGVFDVHPYDVDVSGETGINKKQMAIIENKFANKDTLRVAFISDTHLWHSDARDQVDDLNKRTNIDFVVHCGDLTDTATEIEYEWSRGILMKLNYPFVALIGNHDYLGTGDQIYETMYGDMNFSFIDGRVKVVCLNTNSTEYDYMAAVPNFDWMEEEMVKDSAKFDRTVIVMHAPPFSDQFNNNVCKAFRRYLDYFPGLMCCVYGHVHNDDFGPLYPNDDLIFWGIDCAEDRNYRILTVTPDGYEMEQIFY